MTTILIVEDVPEIANLYEHLLAPYQIHTCLDVNDSMDYLAENHPDLIVLDFYLPAVSGFTLLDYIRTDDSLKDIPVIGMSADHSLARKAKQQGVNAFLTKPRDVAKLLSTVRSLIDAQYTTPRSYFDEGLQTHQN